MRKKFLRLVSCVITFNETEKKNISVLTAERSRRSKK